MNPTSQAVLDLDAELRQLEIKYQGATYTLRSRSELSILELHELSGMLHEYDALTDIEGGDASNAAKIGESLHKIAATLVNGPPEGGFPDQLCAAILGFWTEQHQEEVPPPPRPLRAPQDRKPKQKKALTGAK